MRIFNTVNLRPNDRLSPDHKSWIYNGLDCCVTLEVRNVLRGHLEKEPPNVQETYHTAMEKLAPVNYMCIKGLRVDVEALHQVTAAFRRDLRQLETNFDKICEAVLGYTINWRSHVQVKRLFYETFALKPVRKRNTAGFFAPTANGEALERMCAHFYPQVFARYILSMRDLGKKLSFLETGFDEDLRMRSNLNIAGTNTGRFSSRASAFGSGSNLQNVEDQLRRIFIADPGYILVNVDLEQADARNVAARIWQIFYESEGPERAGAYLDACESGDLHTRVCSMAWQELDWPDPWDAKRAREIADQKAYREMSYRDLAKRLGHGCLTADHEVLTPNGWVSIAEQPSTILQWSPDCATWTKPTHWEAKPYTGVLHEFKGTSISALMTHDHRVPFIKDQKGKKLHERPAEAGPGRYMPLGEGYVGGEVNGLGRLMAAVISDGEIIGRKTRFNFHKLRKVERLIKLCEEAGIEYTEHPDGRISINFCCQKELGPWLLSLDKETALDFLDEYKYWDGHIGKTSVTLTSANRLQLEWLQTLGRLYGIGGNIQKPTTSGFGSTVWRLQQNNRKYASGCAVTHTKRKAKDVMVYCPTVETGWFFVRRQGKIFVTGNTNYFGQPRTMALHTKTDVAIIEEFQARYFEAFPLIPRWHEWVQEQLLSTGQLCNLFGRRRIFFDRAKDPRTLRAAIAYDPQSSTGEELDRGWLRLWHEMPEAELLLPVHDSILFQLPFDRLHELLPRALELLRVTITLEGGRPFSVPLEAAVGWNWAKSTYDKKTKMWKNPYGLRKWTGKEERTPPKVKTRLKHFLS